MRYYLVALRDIVANVYHPPMAAHQLGGAIRDFQDACQGKPDGNLVGKHPEDYELYHIGFYDDRDALITRDGDKYTNDDGEPETFKDRQIAVGKNFRPQ